MDKDYLEFQIMSLLSLLKLIKLFQSPFFLFLPFYIHVPSFLILLATNFRHLTDIFVVIEGYRQSSAILNQKFTAKRWWNHLLA